MTIYTRRQVVQSAGAMGLGLLVGCGRLPGQAGPPKVPRLGRFGIQPPNWPTGTAGTALADGLRELGYIEGVNFHWEDAFANGEPERLPELAATLVQRPVDLIFVAGGTTAALAARDATSTIPIVVGIVGDPVAIGLVASLARPGGNVTGMSSISPQTSGKRLELLRDAIPGLARVAVLWTATDLVKALDYRETEAAAPVLGLTLVSLPVRSAADFDGAFDTAKREGADAFIALGDSVTGGPVAMRRLGELAAARGLPLLLEPREGAEHGAMLTYGPNQPAMFRRAATHVDRILKGAKPADLPIEQPMRFDLVVNLQTAQALGLTIPHHVLLQATEVIQ
jgi:putative tryptophan/tyrosine transport system substrate-binding protein